MCVILCKEPQVYEVSVLIFRAVVLACVVFLSVGCAPVRTKNIDYRVLPTRDTVDTDSASSHYQEGLAALDRCQTGLAEQAFHQSLLADETFGPAHNGLGKIYFECGKLYQAAVEFDRARELMSERSEPINNLGLVYEEAGLLDKAVIQFEEANAVQPDNPIYLGNMIRARIRRGDRTSDLRAFLEHLVLIDDRSEWRAWAQKHLAFNNIDEDYTLGYSESFDASQATPSYDYFESEGQSYDRPWAIEDGSAPEEMPTNRR